GTLYIGTTSDLVRRVWQHKNGDQEGFTKSYRVHRLVWYEAHDSMYQAISREKTIKKWYRIWKIRMVEEANPEWQDLWESIARVDGRRLIAAREPPAAPPD